MADRHDLRPMLYKHNASRCHGVAKTKAMRVDADTHRLVDRALGMPCASHRSSHPGSLKRFENACAAAVIHSVDDFDQNNRFHQSSGIVHGQKRASRTNHTLLYRVTKAALGTIQRRKSSMRPDVQWRSCRESELQLADNVGRCDHGRFGE
ncbi:hypothetical protein [Mesorhizobium sp. M0586]|uniref:hypothetical protein n=1 Tax=unclassified Mesorhizobium TaxID=325217 RepID=UPI00333C95E8